MTTGLAYITVRDDKALRSLSVNEREFIRSSAHALTTLRLDGRRDDEIRKVRIKLGRWDNGAECTVQWGAGTRVTALCTADLVPPSPERPNEGIVNFTVDLSPMAGTAFRQAPAVGTAPVGSNAAASRGPNFADKGQRLLCNRILRSIERIVLVGGALDAEALVLIPGSWVWRITTALTVLDDGGNILDACVMATLATLRHYRKPQVDVGSNPGEQDDVTTVALPTLIPATTKEPSPLPLHHTPLSISFALVPSNDKVSQSAASILVDPEKREELVQFGALTVAMNTHMEVCLLDYCGGHELLPGKLKACLSTAATAVKHLCLELETALEEADQVAQEEMLHSIQLRRSGDRTVAAKIDGNDESSGLPAPAAVEDSIMIESATEDAASEAEEAYRQQALNYSVGHLASSVREDGANHHDRQGTNPGRSLFSALLKVAGSLQGSATEIPQAPSIPKNVHSPRTEDEAQRDQDVMPEIAVPSGHHPIAKQSDSDEEESHMMLKHEFGDGKEHVSSAHQLNDMLPREALKIQQPPENEATIDDLALAFKQKKGKGKRKNK